MSADNLDNGIAIQYAGGTAIVDFHLADGAILWDLF
jgi:hypothetical protein